MPDLLSKQEAAALLGTSHQNVQQLIVRGRLPAIRVGGRWVLARTHVEAYAKERAAKAAKRRKQTA